MKGQVHFRAPVIAGKPLPGDTSRCGVGRRVTGTPAKVTCKRCRVLGEQDDAPADRGRWRLEVAV